MDAFCPPPASSLDPEDRAAVIAEAQNPAVARADGWTVERRLAFLEAVAAGYKVTEAAARSGMTPQGARKLRQRAPEFARVWDEARAFLAEELTESVMHRAIHGSERPVMSRGQQVGVRTHHHDRLALRLLALRDPLNFAPLKDRLAWVVAGRPGGLCPAPQAQADDGRE